VHAPTASWCRRTVGGLVSQAGAVLLCETMRVTGLARGFDTAACANALSLRAYRERRKAVRFSSERDPG